METEFGIPYLSMVTVLICKFRVRYGLDDCRGSLLDVLLARASADGFDVVAKGGLRSVA